MQLPEICLILDPSQSSFETLIPFKINFSHCDMRRCPVKNPSFALNECYGPFINCIFFLRGRARVILIYCLLLHFDTRTFFLAWKYSRHKHITLKVLILKFQLFWEGQKMVAHLPLYFTVLSSIKLSVSWRWVKFLWPSQNIWTFNIHIENPHEWKL